MNKIILSIFFLTTLSSANGVNNTKTNKIAHPDTTLTHDIYFKTNKHTLTSIEFQKLLHFIKTIDTIPIEKISIVGFCDDRGSDMYNKMLSEKRAVAVSNIIKKYSTSKSLDTDGEGEVKLTTAKTTLYNKLRALNRKVTISIIPKKLIAGSFYPEDLKTGDLIILKNLYFKRGYRYLIPESKKVLDELATFLVKRTDIQFTINGHVCCTMGGKESGDKETGKLNLSHVRAKYIRDYLVKKGVDATRAKYQGLKGKYNLGGAPSKDRRVELLIRYVKTQE